ncbi:hypothetical protein HerbRD11066_56220 [Herbidospora sp. RD11066]
MNRAQLTNSSDPMSNREYRENIRDVHDHCYPGKTNVTAPERSRGGDAVVYGVARPLSWRQPSGVPG